MPTRTHPEGAPAAGPRVSAAALIVLGLAAGYLSGLFGVGGGVIVVPILLLLGVDQRIAAGSSVTAILPTAVVGASGYAMSGSVDWIAGLLLAAGIVVGAQLGVWLLARLPRDILFWAFIGSLVLVVVSLWLVVPQREDVIAMTPWVAAALIAVGCITGILSGLLGIGGGIVVVPVLIVFFGASDVIAKGTTLLMMVPGSISATIGNARRRNIDVRIAAIVGLAACAASPLGVLTSQALSPFWSNVAFSLLIAAVLAQLVVRRARGRSNDRRG
ncbi:sulfite exporter TauE/SafE family protein [Microbacterium sp. MYb66]|uniref:sulfite exporter TauE/SafE family protein n=1 Tax=Microbacterium sp. MYb66 TaxID=1848692 RepID=UPI000D006C90|nr:sulfite exporter TauE/SafE family protein [Microbacterium sp. MYb66]PRA79078.1 permease [Microbacterium sp. MYb66]